MAHAEHSVIVARPIDEVFDFIADGSNNPRWRSAVLDVARGSGDDGLGVIWRQGIKGPGGRRISGDYRITTWERPVKLGFEVISGPARPTGMYTLVAEGPSRTSVTFTLDLHPSGPMRLMGPMISRQVTKEVTSLDRLDEALKR